MTRRQSRLIWFLIAANLLAIATVAWISWSKRPSGTAPLSVTAVRFSDLPDWDKSDPSAALAAFGRSCGVLSKLPPNQIMGWAAYAGRTAEWTVACGALPSTSGSAARARAYFETWFTPLAIGGNDGGHFTGYYEPLLQGSHTSSARYRVPVYGRPSDIVSVDLGQFHHALLGQQIVGRLEAGKLDPYRTRADIDAHGLSSAPILLYANDPISLFLLQIQGSGRVKFADGQTLRLSFAGTNGKTYTPIGRVLLAMGALQRGNVSLQTIRTWLEVHPSAARGLMDTDQSYVFFQTAPLGDPALGSPGSEGVPLTPDASVAVDPRFHPLGAPVYVATAIPDKGTGQNKAFEQLLVAQDTGGAIKGPGRSDIFFGAGSEAEAAAGRMNARGRFFVLVPKKVAEALPHDLRLPEASP